MRLTPEKIQPVAQEQFPNHGRGPVLHRVIYSDESGTYLKGIEYGTRTLKHIRIIGPQAYMVTPEEVINYTDWARGFNQCLGAAALDLGRSDWLLSFSPRHLSKCRHFQLLFYDELFDIICEGLEFKDGPYEDHSA